MVSARSLGAHIPHPSHFHHGGIRSTMGSQVKVPDLLSDHWLFCKAPPYSPTPIYLPVLPDLCIARFSLLCPREWSWLLSPAILSFLFQFLYHILPVMTHTLFECLFLDNSRPRDCPHGDEFRNICKRLFFIIWAFHPHGTEYTTIWNCHPCISCLQPIRIFADIMTPWRHLSLNPLVLTLTTTAMTMTMAMLLIFFSVFGVFLWQCYSASYSPGIYTTAVSVVLCGHTHFLRQCRVYGKLF